MDGQMSCLAVLPRDELAAFEEAIAQGLQQRSKTKTQDVSGLQSLRLSHVFSLLEPCAAKDDFEVATLLATLLAKLGCHVPSKSRRAHLTARQMRMDHSKDAVKKLLKPVLGQVKHGSNDSCSETPVCS